MRYIKTKSSSCLSGIPVSFGTFPWWRRMFCLLCLVCFIAPGAWAANYYVTNTTVNGTGTIVSPWTLKNAVQQINNQTVKAGDTIYVRGGSTYYSPMGESYHTITQSGSVGAFITITNYPGETPVIDNEQKIGEFFRLTGSYIRVAGLHFQNNTNTYGFAVTGSNCVVQNIVLSNAWQGGFYIKGNNNQILSNLVIQCTAGNRNLDMAGAGCAIAIANMTGWVYPYDAPSNLITNAAQIAAQEKNLACNNLIQGNDCHDNWGDGIDAFQSYGTIIDGNVSYNNWSIQIYVETSRDVIVRNNLAYRTTDAPVPQRGGPLFSLNTECWNKPAACDNLVVNNMFYSQDGRNNVALYGGSTTADTGAIGVLIANNTLINSPFTFADNSTPVMVNNSSISTNNWDTRIQNNIFYYNIAGSMVRNYYQPNYTGRGLTFTNNVWFHVGGLNFGAGCGFVTNSGDYFGDPQLALAGPTGAGNYTFAYFMPTNAAVTNRGTPLYGVTDQYWVTNTTMPFSVGACDPANPPFQYTTNAAADLYALTVSNGFGSGKYVAGETLAILAPISTNTTNHCVADANQYFNWRVISGASPSIIVDALNPLTALTMPASNVVVLAEYGLATNVTPAAGPVTGNSSVVISGVSLGSGAGVASVTICGVNATIQSQTPSTVTVLTGVSGQVVTGGDVVLTSSNNNLVVICPDSYSYYAPVATPTALPGSGITATSFYANWMAVSGATNYLLDVSAATNFSSFVTGYNNLSVGTVTNYQVTGLATGLAYYYRVRAQQNDIASSNSSIIYLPCATMTAQAGPTNGGSVTGGGTFLVGSTNVITATASNNWVFTQWIDGVTDNPRSVVMPASGTNCTANFSSLTVPTMGNSGLYANQFGFLMGGALNQTVVVEACTNLSAPVWVPLQTNTLNGSPVYFGDSTTPQPSARYYRLRSQ
ncbi:MAG: right-handed parallel beta-helix repeat-containing protein [Verrucomicrobiales bacterium]|nr:right-handed parallel beta-helix repeat-containing protein [Verrucomicrobiales bacterium]